MYEVDIRHIVHHGTDEEASNRLRAFRTGWTDAVNGRQFTADTLSRVTWTNVGWRIGQVIGPTSQDIQEQLFTLLADLQTAQQRSVPDGGDE